MPSKITQPLPHPESLFKPQPSKVTPNEVTRDPTPQERIAALRKKREASARMKEAIAAAGLTVDDVLATLNAK